VTRSERLAYLRRNYRRRATSNRQRGLTAHGSPVIRPWAVGHTYQNKHT